MILNNINVFLQNSCIPELLSWILTFSIIVVQSRWHMHHNNIFFLLICGLSGISIKQVLKPCNLLLSLPCWISQINPVCLIKICKSVRCPIYRIYANDSELVIEWILVPASTSSSGDVTGESFIDRFLDSWEFAKMLNICRYLLKPKFIQVFKLWIWICISVEESGHWWSIVNHVIIVSKSRNYRYVRKLWLN